MTELEQLRGEVVAMREALEHIVSLNNHYTHSEMCETAHPDVQSARFEDWTEEQIEADMLDNCCCPVRQVYFANKALAASPLSEKVAAVVSAAIIVGNLNREQMDSIRPMTNGALDAYHRLEDTVDALQEATK